MLVSLSFKLESFLNERAEYMRVSVFLADSDLGEMKVALDLLPADLQKCVTEDNVKFEREIREWDEEVQHRKDAQTTKLQGPSTQQAANTNLRGCKSEGWSQKFWIFC